MKQKLFTMKVKVVPFVHHCFSVSALCSAFSSFIFPWLVEVVSELPSGL